MPGKKKLSTQRKAAMVIPWVREVMAVGEEMTAKEVIARIKENNTPRTGTSLMQVSERKHTRNLRNLRRPIPFPIFSVLQVNMNESRMMEP